MNIEAQARSAAVATTACRYLRPVVERRVLRALRAAVRNGQSAERIAALAAALTALKG